MERHSSSPYSGCWMKRQKRSTDAEHQREHNLWDTVKSLQVLRETQVQQLLWTWVILQADLKTVVWDNSSAHVLSLIHKKTQVSAFVCMRLILMSLSLLQCSTENDINKLYEVPCAVLCWASVVSDFSCVWLKWSHFSCVWLFATLWIVAC